MGTIFFVCWHDFSENVLPAQVGTTILDIDTKHLNLKISLYRPRHGPDTPILVMMFGPIGRLALQKKLLKPILFQHFRFPALPSTFLCPSCSQSDIKVTQKWPDPPSYTQCKPRYPQRKSTNINESQRKSTRINEHQRESKRINEGQRTSMRINENQRTSMKTNDNHRMSTIINENQTESTNIK